MWDHWRAFCMLFFFFFFSFWCLCCAGSTRREAVLTRRFWLTISSSGSSFTAQKARCSPGMWDKSGLKPSFAPTAHVSPRLPGTVSQLIIWSFKAALEFHCSSVKQGIRRLLLHFCKCKTKITVCSLKTNQTFLYPSTQLSKILITKSTHWLSYYPHRLETNIRFYTRQCSFSQDRRRQHPPPLLLWLLPRVCVRWSCFCVRVFFWFCFCS